MTLGQVRGGQEAAGHLGPTPLPVRASKLSIAYVLTNLDGTILTWERDLKDDLILVKLTLRHPEIRTLRGDGREEQEKEKVFFHVGGQ